MWHIVAHMICMTSVTIEIKAGLDEVISVIVYSVQKGDHLKVNFVLVLTVTIVTHCDRIGHHYTQQNMSCYKKTCTNILSEM